MELTQEEAAYAAQIVRLGACSPHVLALNTGRHVQGLNGSDGIAGHLRAVEGNKAVIVNGFGVTHVNVGAFIWLVHPHQFTLGGKPVS
ncbi:hypothetical protein [Streptomyces sp. NBC_01304]|uniref:hypothetical protein n=1 Tax=Streptomyces sp. NBC_01304 TaxID=2903818 RepID=UPI002E0E90D8|nr:hypothetical protein OG430_47530 [Streptomyces sp. NBC_01304]